MIVTIEEPQYLDALAKANQVRCDRAKVKNDIKTGKVAVCSILLDPPACCRTMTIRELLLCQPRYGMKRVSKLLARIGITSTRQIQVITARQTALIARELSR